MHNASAAYDHPPTAGASGYSHQAGRGASTTAHPYWWWCTACAARAMRPITSSATQATSMVDDSGVRSGGVRLLRRPACTAAMRDGRSEATDRLDTVRAMDRVRPREWLRCRPPIAAANMAADDYDEVPNLRSCQ